MSRGPLIATYLGIIRKHWILVLAIAVAVAAGGYVYLSQQVAVFEATAKLKIIRQPPRRSASEVSFSFEEDQFFYNTQYNLLTTQLDWAEQALDRAAFLLLLRLEIDWEADPAAAGAACASVVGARLNGAHLEKLGGWLVEDDIDALVGAKERSARRLAVELVRAEVIRDLWGFNADSFLASVAAAPIPNTYLAKLTLRARDPGVAVFLVNLYAELYRDVSREEREETLGKELAFRDAQRDAAQKKLEDAQTELQEFREDNKGHPELALDEPVNLAQQQVASLTAKLDELDTERILARGEEEHVLAVLASRGVSVVEPEDGPIRLARSEDKGGNLDRFLAEDLPILGLRAVEASANVRLLRSRLRGLEEEANRLRVEFTEESEEMKRLRTRMAQATRELGAEVGAVVLRFLESRRRAVSVHRELSDRLEDKRREARALHALYSDLRELTEKVAVLKQEKETLAREHQALFELQKMKEEASGGPLMIQNIELERRARLVDARQVQPRSMLILLLTALAAVFLSFGSAFLLEFLDDTVKSKQDFERLVMLPDIGVLPRITEKEFEKKDTAVLLQPRSGVAEAFRSLRTGVLFSRRDEEIKSCLITSAGPGEGKTTVAINLAITMAQAGRGPVLLIDADLRKSRVHTALGIENEVGLTNCLVGSETLGEAVRETEIDNLFVLTSGPTPPNPAELLGGLRAGEILREAQEKYAKVILDTPPLVAVTDTCLLSTQVDGVFLVVSVGKTSWRLIQQGKEALAAVGVKAAGGILNNMRTKHRGYAYEPYYQW